MRRPKVKLDNLIAFMTVAAQRNVDDAADELGLSASGVRKQLDNIENTFGIRLFESIRVSLILTEDGGNSVQPPPAVQKTHSSNEIDASVESAMAEMNLSMRLREDVLLKLGQMQRN